MNGNNVHTYTCHIVQLSTTRNSSFIDVSYGSFHANSLTFFPSISDFDEIEQICWPLKKSNTHHVSAHYHQYWWSCCTLKMSEMFQNIRLWDTTYTLTWKVTDCFETLLPSERGDNILSDDMLLDHIWHFKVFFWDLNLWPTFSEIPHRQFSWILHVKQIWLHHWFLP